MIGKPFDNLKNDFDLDHDVIQLCQNMTVINQNGKHFQTNMAQLASISKVFHDAAFHENNLNISDDIILMLPEVSDEAIGKLELILHISNIHFSEEFYNNTPELIKNDLEILCFQFQYDLWSQKSESQKQKQKISPKYKQIISPKQKQSISPKQKQNISPKHKQNISPKQKQIISPKQKQSISPKKKQNISPKQKQIISLRQKQNIGQNQELIQDVNQIEIKIEDSIKIEEDIVDNSFESFYGTLEDENNHFQDSVSSLSDEMNYNEENQEEKPTKRKRNMLEGEEDWIKEEEDDDEEEEDNKEEVVEVMIKRTKITETKKTRQTRVTEKTEDVTETTSDDKEIVEKCKRSVRKYRAGYKCRVCDMVLSTGRERVKHMRMAHKGVKITCPKCYRSFSVLNRDKFEEHLKLHDRFPVCISCGQEFGSKTFTNPQENIIKLASEKVTHNLEWAYKTAVQQYERHLKIYGPNHCDNKCVYETCDASFTSWSEKLDHVNSFHKGEMKFACGHCEEKFDEKITLDLHVKNFHPPVWEKNYVCEICSKSFVGKRTLVVHIELTHKQSSESDRQPCKICNKYFKARSMEKHLATHGPKTFICNHCGKGFHRNCNLVNHILNSHTPDDQKPYKCQYCPKAFTNFPNLETHENIHNNVKPYNCRVCNLAFTDKSNVHQHERRVHKIVHEKHKQILKENVEMPEN